MYNKKQTIFNLPNIISLIRILLIPVIVLFALLQNITTKNGLKNGLYFAIPLLIFFIVASVTDFVDGKIARKTNQVTTLGKFLDTLADKLLVITMIVIITSMQSNIYSIGYYSLGIDSNLTKTILQTEKNIYLFMIIVTVIIIAREFLVTGLRQMAASKNIIMQADIYGKIKTFLTLITIGFNLLTPFFIIGFEKALLNSNIYEYKEIATKILKRTLSFEIFVCFLWFLCLVITILSAINYFLKNYKVLLDEKKEEKDNVTNEENIINNSKDEILDNENSNITIDAEIVE